MNKRIKELAEQAGASIEENTLAFPVVFGEMEDFEKFAELIIKECSEFTDPVTQKLMMKHFGVE